MNIVLFRLLENLVLEKVWVKLYSHYCDPSATSDELHILTNVGLISTGQVRTYFDTLIISLEFEDLLSTRKCESKGVSCIVNRF